MSPEEITVSIIDALNAENIPYMLVGSLSSNYYSIPRATQDADFVVQSGTGVISAIAKRLGSRFNLVRQASFEVLTATQRYEFRVEGSPFSVELFVLSDDEHDQERFGRRSRKRILDRDVFLPSVEDVIITKLRWALAGNRVKDLEDVKNILAVQGDNIDWDYVTSWCDRHGTRELLDNARK